MTYLKNLLLFLVSVCSWSALKKVGNSYISVASAIIPVLGYLLFSFDSLLVLSLQLQKIVEENFAVELPWAAPEGVERLRMTYVGLSMVGLTTIIFQIFCPRQIQAFKDERSFVETSLQISNPAEADRLAADISQNRWIDRILRPEPVRSIRINNDYTGPSPSVHARKGESSQLKRSEWFEQNSLEHTEGYRQQYRDADLSYLILRAPIFFSFLTGYALTLIPSIELLLPQMKSVFERVL